MNHTNTLSNQSSKLLHLSHELACQSMNSITCVNMLDNLFMLIKLNNTNKFMINLKIYHKKGLHIDQIDQYGNTLLHMACRNRNYTIVKTLICDYNARCDIQNQDERNALHFATIYGSTNIAYYLSNDGSTKKQIENSSDIINLLTNNAPYTLMMKDKDNMTPINYYSLHSDLENNNNLYKHYKAYKHKSKFFDLIKNNTDYKLTMSIYFLTRHAKY